MKTLFDMPPIQLSPRLEWERKHRIKTECNNDMEEPWCASQSIKSCGHSFCHHGEQFSTIAMTRDEAIAKLVVKLGITPYGVDRMNEV